MKRNLLISQMNGNCSVHGWLFHFPVPLTMVAQSFPSTLFGSFLFQFSYFLLNPSLFGFDHFQSPSFAASEYPIQACSTFLDLTIISRSSFWICDAIDTSSPFKLLQCLPASVHDFFSFTNWYNPEEFHHIGLLSYAIDIQPRYQFQCENAVHTTCQLQINFLKIITVWYFLRGIKHIKPTRSFNLAYHSQSQVLMIFISMP